MPPNSKNLLKKGENNNYKSGGTKPKPTKKNRKQKRTQRTERKAAQKYIMGIYS